MRNAALAVTLLIPLGVPLGMPLDAHAGGIFVGESGSQVMERGGAFVAKADDPTALWLNPAGLVKTKNIAIYLGANLLSYSLKFQRAGGYPTQLREVQPAYAGTPYKKSDNDGGFQPVPTLAAAFRWKDLGIGVGVYAPAAVPGRDFPCSSADQFCQVDANGAPAPQRYDVVSEKGLIAYPSLALAYRVHERVDLGARASWGIANVEARNFPWALPNDPEDPKSEADFEIDVSDKFMPTFGVGLLVRPLDALEIGVSYSSKTQVRAKGTGNAALGPDAAGPIGIQTFLEPKPDDAALCGTGGTTSALKSCLDFDLPQSLSFGARWVFRDQHGVERGDFEVDGKWENWSQASNDTITVDGQDMQTGLTLKPVLNKHGFQDTLAVRVGGAYVMDVGANLLTLRAGFAIDTAAAPDRWTRVDKDGRGRQTFSGGVAYEIPRWRFDLGLAYVHEGSVRVVDDPVTTRPMADRTQPDVLQPSVAKDQQRHHPYNAGLYESGYIDGLLGVTTMF